MKMQRQVYDDLKAGIRAVIENRGLQVLKSTLSWSSPRRLMWSLYWLLWHDLKFDDDHPSYRVEGRERIVPHKPGWDVYTDGVSDNHVETALLKIGRELGLLTRTRHSGDERRRP